MLKFITLQVQQVHSVAPSPHNRVRRLAWNAAWSGANAAAALGRAVARRSYPTQAAYSDFFPTFAQRPAALSPIHFYHSSFRRSPANNK